MLACRGGPPRLEAVSDPRNCASWPRFRLAIRATNDAIWDLDLTGSMATVVSAVCSSNRTLAALKRRFGHRTLSALFPAATAHIEPLRPNAHRIIKGSSLRHISSLWPAGRSLITTSALASRNAAAHRVAFSRKNGSRVPATRYVRGNRLGITSGGR
jgi:hypothetical protein